MANSRKLLVNEFNHWPVAKFRGEISQLPLGHPLVRAEQCMLQYRNILC